MGDLLLMLLSFFNAFWFVEDGGDKEKKLMILGTLVPPSPLCTSYSGCSVISTAPCP